MDKKNVKSVYKKICYGHTMTLFCLKNLTEPYIRNTEIFPTGSMKFNYELTSTRIILYNLPCAFINPILIALHMQVSVTVFAAIFLKICQNCGGRHRLINIST